MSLLKKQYIIQNLIANKRKKTQPNQKALPTTQIKIVNLKTMLKRVATKVSKNKRVKHQRPFNHQQNLILNHNNRRLN